MVFIYESAKISTPAEGIMRRILAHCPEVMVTEHKLDKGLFCLNTSIRMSRLFTWY
jgi:hypothetical protein